MKDLPLEEQDLYLDQLLSDFVKKRDTERKTEHQKPYNLYLQKIKEKFKPKYPHVYKFESWPLNDALITALASGSPDRLRAIAKEVSPGIYAFDMLPASFCEDLILEVEHFQDWCDKEEIVVMRPNTMNNYGAILDQFGSDKFEAVLDQVMKKVVSPFSEILYPWIHKKGVLDYHHGFVVEYQQGKDTKLDFHVDQSEVTLNLCLGRTFTGGDLTFKGVRCQSHVQTPSKPGEDFDFAHKRGQAILHVGKHRHLAKRIASGHRLNLILWCRNLAFSEESGRIPGEGKRSSCVPWCWHDR